jgi:hypothetical protein
MVALEIVKRYITIMSNNRKKGERVRERTCHDHQSNQRGCAWCALDI